jgi:hypothetical protein
VLHAVPAKDLKDFACLDILLVCVEDIQGVIEFDFAGVDLADQKLAVVGVMLLL